MDKTNQKTVVIFGSSRPEPGSLEYQQAYEVGKMLAQTGCGVANGGYSGTMAATARGFAETRTDPDSYPIVGVTCDAFGRSGPNSWIDKEIRTKNLSKRLDTLLNLGDAYVVLPGSTGTLLEIAMVWELINKHFLPPRPIIFLSQYWKPVTDTVVQAGEADADCLVFADTLDQLRRILSEKVS